LNIVKKKKLKEFVEIVEENPSNE